ncbi:hypothetical protein [Pseudomonas sp. IT-P74]
MKKVKSSQTSKTNSIEQPMEISVLNAPSLPKRAPKFLVQGDSNRLRY